MHPALLGHAVLPPPAARAWVFPFQHCPCAGCATDAGITSVVELVVRDVVPTYIVPDLLLAPVRQRADLDDASVSAVKRDLRDVRSGLALGPAQAGYPGIQTAQRPVEGLDLAQVAAEQS